MLKNQIEELPIVEGWYSGIDRPVATSFFFDGQLYYKMDTLSVAPVRVFESKKACLEHMLRKAKEAEQEASQRLVEATARKNEILGEMEKQ